MTMYDARLGNARLESAWLDVNGKIYLLALGNWLSRVCDE